MKTTATTNISLSWNEWLAKASGQIPATPEPIITNTITAVQPALSPLRGRERTVGNVGWPRHTHLPPAQLTLGLY